MEYFFGTQGTYILSKIVHTVTLRVVTFAILLFMTGSQLTKMVILTIYNLIKAETF